MSGFRGHVGHICSAGVDPCRPSPLVRTCCPRGPIRLHCPFLRNRRRSKASQVITAAGQHCERPLSPTPGASAAIPPVIPNQHTSISPLTPADPGTHPSHNGSNNSSTNGSIPGTRNLKLLVPLASALCSADALSGLTLSAQAGTTRPASNVPPLPCKESPAGSTTAAMDGNQAAATMAYAMSDISFVFPITPATPMGEHCDTWATQGRKNMHGNVMQLVQMEAEGGCAGAMHGSAVAGGLVTSFTSSQGLLLYIPDMYRIAGEMLPCVLHVATRSVGGQVLSVCGDHQDVMSVRTTGWAMLSSANVQEAADLALVSHLATLRAKVPFVHFFDGFRTSHEINKISVLSAEAMQPLLDLVAPDIQAHRARALNPAHPRVQGVITGADVYFQIQESASTYYKQVPDIVEETMSWVSTLTGRPLHPFDYVGHPEAERVIVAMGSSCQVAEEAVNYLVAQGEKVGLVKVRLYRPWSAEKFMDVLPPTVKRIAVLDRVKEAGSEGEPLYLDVASTMQRQWQRVQSSSREAADQAGVLVVGGRYGIGGKDFTPTMVKAVFDTLAQVQPKDGFTVGITDDVSFTSLPLGPEISTLPPGTKQCIFWGMGADGTVGANHEAVRIIAEQPGVYAQAYFSFDAHKSGGVTVSHLRFGPSPINSSYLISEADYLGIHKDNYLSRFDCLSRLAPGGVLVINTTLQTPQDMEEALPHGVLQQLATLQPQLYLVDARAVAEAAGLGERINMVMQTVFFHLSGVLPMEEAIPLLKESIQRAYGMKGEKVVAENFAAVDGALKGLKKINIPSSWASLAASNGNTSSSQRRNGSSSYVEDIVRPMLALEGDDLPVSSFLDLKLCSLPPSTAALEKRAIAAAIPSWQPEACTQCNTCAFVCPHAAIRPAILTQEEAAAAPEDFDSKALKGGKGLQGLQYRLQVSPQDCTGCEVCIEACPQEALVPQPLKSQLTTQAANWDYYQHLPNRGDLFERASVRGSQFQQPLLEFSGACSGCGETSYVKLLTQLFGDRLVIANALGCSSVWSASAPVNPYTVNADGRGPAWATSLYEDNAQFGLGIAVTLGQRREELREQVIGLLERGGAAEVGSPALREALGRWLKVYDDGGQCRRVSSTVQHLLQQEAATHPLLAQLQEQQDQLDKPCVWIVGGDGWAYDIGFGGLDHVMASGVDVNVLVLDNEMYSNTGGQKSKATPLGAVAKLAAGGTLRPKKDMGLMMMETYSQDVYVASVCLEANMQQVINAMVEAAAHPGPSLVLGYAPCILQGLHDGMESAVSEAHLAVDSGYWPLYRYHPQSSSSSTTLPVEHAADAKGIEGAVEAVPATAEGSAATAQSLSEGKLVLDVKKTKKSLGDFLKNELRFTMLARKNPEQAARLQRQLESNVQRRMARLNRMASGLPP